MCIYTNIHTCIYGGNQLTTVNTHFIDLTHVENIPVTEYFVANDVSYIHTCTCAHAHTCVQTHNTYTRTHA